MVNVFKEILGMSVDSVWLIGAIIIARALLYKAPKCFHKMLWGLAGLRLTIPFSLESVFSLVPAEIPETVDRVAVQTAVAPTEQGISFIEIIPIMWGVIGFAFMCYGVISYVKLKAKIFDAVIYNDNIYYSEKIESPFVCGFIKPKIYIPYGLDSETQKYVLQHEKMHIKHGDHILKCLGFVVLCVHWFNPLVWVAYFLLCKDIELACDESVVKNYVEEDCKQYAKALLALGVNKVKLSACPVAFGEVSIKTRIKSVINYKKASKILVFASLCLCIGVSLCFMTEPETSLKEKAEEVEVVEATTEPTTEKVTEPTTEVATEPETETEPITEPATESETEAVVEVYETVEEATIAYEELNSIFQSGNERVEEESVRYNENLMADGYQNDQSNWGSNSNLNSTKPSNTVELPTFNWDPGVTGQGGLNYHHTSPYNPNNPNRFNTW